MKKYKLTILVVTFLGLYLGMALANGIEASKGGVHFCDSKDIILKGVYGERAGFKIDNRLRYVKEGKQLCPGIIIEKISEGGSMVILSTPDGKKVVKKGESLSEVSLQREPIINVKKPDEALSVSQEKVTPLSRKEKLKFKEYKVKKGDSLWSIAEREYGDGNKWKKIYEYNKDKIKNPDRLKDGINLLIPLE